MLPTNSIQTTRLNAEELPQAPRATTQVLDVLSEYVPGQKLMAQIQFQLANGAYRATIAQRDVTLALPFSAKPGDSLELEVVEIGGRTAFAISKAPADQGNPGNTPAASASTTLSRTGQLIGQLLQDSDAEQPKPAPLNAGQPVLKGLPTSGKEMVPALQQAISRSGLFYESHQAAWVDGKLPEAVLRQEPQALLAKSSLQNLSGNATSPTGSPPGSPPGGPGAAGPGVALASLSTAAQAASQNSDTAGAPTALIKPSDPGTEAAQGAERAKTLTPLATADASSPSSSARAGHALPPDLAPLVQQQLASLANNVYPFQGVIWPGQQIQWEIVDENGGQGAADPDEAPRQWKTRLKLLLPSLGDIDATIQLDGNDIVVQMKTSEANTQSKLKGNIEGLRSRLDLAGLRLMALDVKGYDSDERPG